MVNANTLGEHCLKSPGLVFNEPSQPHNQLIRALMVLEIRFTMVELYLNAKLHSRISEAAYRSLLTLKDLDDQDLKLRSDLLKQVDSGSIRLT